MALLDGLRGGQALLNMVEFGPGIQAPDESKMYSMALAGGASGSSIGNKGKQEKTNAPKYLFGASKEYMLGQQAIENAKVQMGNQLYQEYKDSGKSFSTWQRSNGQNIMNKMNELNEMEINLMSVHNMEENNVKMFNKISSDSEAARDIAFISGGNTIGIEIATPGQDEKGKPRTVKSTKEIYSEDFPFLRSMQIKVLNNNNLTKEDSEKAKSLLGDNYLGILSSSSITPVTQHIYAYQQNLAKPLGVNYDEAGYQNPERKNEADTRATLLIKSASEQINSSVSLSGSDLNYISSGYGGVRYKVTNTSSAGNLQNQINTYFNTMSDGDRQYWKNEWLKAVNQNQIGPTYQFKGEGNNKVMEVVMTPVADMKLEEYVRSSIMYRAQPKVGQDINENITQMSGARIGIEDKQKANFFFRYYNRQLNPGIDFYSRSQDIDNTSNPISAMFTDAMNEAIENSKALMKQNKFTDEQIEAQFQNPETMNAITQKVKDRLVLEIRKGNIVKDEGTFKNVINFFDDVIAGMDGREKENIDLRNAKNASDLINIVNNLTTDDLQRLYLAKVYPVPTTDRNKISQVFQNVDVNETINVAGMELKPSDFGQNVSLRMAQDEDIKIIETGAGSNTKAVLKGSYIVDTGDEKTSIEYIKKNLKNAGIPEFISDKLIIRETNKKYTGEDGKPKTKKVLLIKGSSDLTPQQLENLINFEGYQQESGLIQYNTNSNYTYTN